MEMVDEAQKARPHRIDEKDVEVKRAMPREVCWFIVTYSIAMVCTANGKVGIDSAKLLTANFLYIYEFIFGCGVVFLLYKTLNIDTSELTGIHGNNGNGKKGNGKLGNEKRRRRKKRQHLCNRGKNGNGKIGQRKKGQPENSILDE